LNLIRNAKTADYLHVNNMSVLGANHWVSAGDKRFDPDNVLIDSRNANVTVIIDKKTGKVVWMLGPYYPINGSWLVSIWRESPHYQGHDARTF